MKIGLIGDIHFGCHNDDEYFQNYIIQSLSDTLDYFISNKINTIIFLGDLIDSRNKIHIKTLHLIKNLFKNYNSKFEKIYIIKGNHDYLNKSSGKISSINPIFEDFKSVYIIEDIEQLEFDNHKILLCSWVFNYEEFKEKLKKYNAEIIFGHFEIKGFQMIKNYINKNRGLDNDYFKHYKDIISAHFHIYSNKDNITYLGSLCQLDWNDCDIKKYYGIYDTVTGLELIENKNYIYDRIYVSQFNKNINYSNKIVKLINDDNKDISDIIKLINKQNPYQFNVEDYYKKDNNNNENIDTNTDLLSMSIEYIKKNEFDCDENKLINKFIGMYKNVNNK